MAPTSGSLSMASSARRSSAMSPSQSALSACGRFSWISPTFFCAPVFCTSRYWNAAPARRTSTGPLAHRLPGTGQTPGHPRQRLATVTACYLKATFVPAVTGSRRDVTGDLARRSSRCHPGPRRRSPVTTLCWDSVRGPGTQCWDPVHGPGTPVPGAGPQCRCPAVRCYCPSMAQGPGAR